MPPPTPPPPSNILCFSFRFDLSVCLRKLYWCPKLLFLSYEKHDIKMKRDPPLCSLCMFLDSGSYFSLSLVHLQVCLLFPICTDLGFISVVIIKSVLAEAEVWTQLIFCFS